MMEGFGSTGSTRSWRSASKCSTLPPARADELFFADGAHPDTVAHAKTYCSTCPVKAQCAAWGAAINAEFGVYGGVPSYARKSLVSLFRQAHPDEDTAALSEDERFTRFAEWIEKDPSVTSIMPATRIIARTGGGSVHAWSVSRLGISNLMGLFV